MKNNRSLFRIILILLWCGVGAFRIISDDMKTGLICFAVAAIFAVSMLFSKKAANK